jgi:hypothetical protein
MVYCIENTRKRDHHGEPGTVVLLLCERVLGEEKRSLSFSSSASSGSSSKSSRTITATSRKAVGSGHGEDQDEDGGGGPASKVKMVKKLRVGLSFSDDA